MQLYLSCISLPSCLYQISMVIGDVSFPLHHSMMGISGRLSVLRDVSLVVATQPFSATFLPVSGHESLMLYQTPSVEDEIGAVRKGGVRSSFGLPGTGHPTSQGRFRLWSTTNHASPPSLQYLTASRHNRAVHHIAASFVVGEIVISNLPGRFFRLSLLHHSPTNSSRAPQSALGCIYASASYVLATSKLSQKAHPVDDKS